METHPEKKTSITLLKQNQPLVRNLFQQMYCEEAYDLLQAIYSLEITQDYALNLYLSNYLNYYLLDSYKDQTFADYRFPFIEYHREMIPSTERDRKNKEAWLQFHQAEFTRNLTAYEAQFEDKVLNHIQETFLMTRDSKIELHGPLTTEKFNQLFALNNKLLKIALLHQTQSQLEKLLGNTIDQCRAKTAKLSDHALFQPDTAPKSSSSHKCCIII